MAPATTPRRSANRKPGRPLSQKRASAGTVSERPEKRLRYIPGGPGGGGRYIDEEGNETPVGGTGPGGPGFSGVRRRSSHRATTGSPPAAASRPRRTPVPPQPRYNSTAAAAASAMSSEGYKPREERSWEEFHPDLDIEVDLLVFGAEEVDGGSRSSNPVSPFRGFARSLTDNGAVSAVDNALRAQQTPGLNGLSEFDNPFSTMPAIMTPLKRRPGRPPKHQMLSGLGSPPAPRIMPLPTYNPKERLSLPKPNYRRIETFKKFEEAKNVGVNFVDKSMANVGFQETDRFARAAETYIRAPEAFFEDELEVAHALRKEGDDSATIGRVEYDMDEQDERWLESINIERQAEQVDAIKPAIFEITMTQIEKEWHALEKRKYHSQAAISRSHVLTRLQEYLNHPRKLRRPIDRGQDRRRPSMEKLAGRAKNKTPSVQYAMTAIAKTLMQLFFAMVAILLFIKNVTECLSSRKANGIVGSASSLAKTTS
jgi:NuA3 HAT complex component NTO1